MTSTTQTWVEQIIRQARPKVASGKHIAWSLGSGIEGAFPRRQSPARKQVQDGLQMLAGSAVLAVRKGRVPYVPAEGRRMLFRGDRHLFPLERTAIMHLYDVPAAEHLALIDATIALLDGTGAPAIPPFFPSNPWGFGSTEGLTMKQFDDIIALLARLDEVKADPSVLPATIESLAFANFISGRAGDTATVASVNKGKALLEALVA